MKTWHRRTGLLLAGLVVVFTCALGVEHVRGRYALNARLNALKTKGERFNVSELEPAHPTTARNAARALAALTNEIHQVHTNLSEFPPFGRFAAPGQMMPAWKLTSWLGEKNGAGPLKTNDWRHPVQVLNASRDVVDAIHNALLKPDWNTGFNYRNGFFDFQAPIPVLTHTKSVSRILAIAAAGDLQQGKIDAALERLVDNVSLLRLQKSDPLIISQLVRLACAAVAWNSGWELLQTNAWSEAQLAKLQTVWQDMDFSIDMGRALEMERGMTLDLFRFLSSSGSKAGRYFQQQEEVGEKFGMDFITLPTRGAVLHWVHIPIWRIAWINQDALRALNRWQDLIEIDRMARSNSWSMAKDRADRYNAAGNLSDSTEQGMYNRWRYLLSNQTFGVNGNLVLRTLEPETARRMIVTAIALKRSHLRLGHQAKSLDDLVPDFLASVPVDCMDGKPLRYHPKPDGTFVLYSVGEDGIDDGGDSSLVKGKTKYAKIWDGKDAVWPSSSSIEEDKSPGKH